MIDLDSRAEQRIKEFMTANGLLRPWRIEIRTSGCCDPVLRIFPDDYLDGDLKQEVNGLVFVIEPDVFRLIGEVTIRPAEGDDSSGLILTTTRPLTEWDGFNATPLEIKG